MLRPLRAATLLLILAALSTPALADPPRIPAEVRDHIRQRVDAGFAPGIVVGLVNPDGQTYFAYGHTALDTDHAVDEHTIFELASITKTFTAILLADLVQRGVVSLDDPVEKYLPDAVHTPSRDGQKITLRHLVTHRAGLPSVPTNFEPADPDNPWADYTEQQLYEFLASYSLPHKIGTVCRYSNVGVGLLGHALSRAAGKPYEQLVRQHICQPLGMYDTGITLTAEQQARLALPHRNEQQVSAWDFDCLAGAGSLRSTAHDMLRYLAANIGLIDTPLRDAMKMTHENRQPSGYLGTLIALAWHVNVLYGTEIIWHNGATGGYWCFCGFRPDTKRGVVVLSNYMYDLDRIGLHLLEPKYELGKVRRAIDLSPDVLDRYVGRYQLEPDEIYTVTRDGRRLVVQLTGEDAFPVYPESQTDFFYRAFASRLCFELDSDGRVTGLTIPGMFQRRASRLPDHSGM